MYSLYMCSDRCFRNPSTASALVECSLRVFESVDVGIITIASPTINTAGNVREVVAGQQFSL